MRNINDFRAALKYGGARSSLFEVRITNPALGVADNILPFMCKAAALPGMTNTPIEVFHFGRAIKVAGNRTFEDWTTTIINDEDYAIRNALETWSNMINGLESNVRKFSTSEPAQYKSTAQIYQWDQTQSQVLRSYKIVGLFPNNIAPVEMAWENETIHDTVVTWSYDYWLPGEGITGDHGGF